MSTAADRAREIRQAGKEAIEIARMIDESPPEWTPNFTRSELLPLARSYLRVNAPVVVSDPPTSNRNEET